MRKILQSFIMLLATFTVSVQAYAAGGATMIGDVDCDDNVNINDVTTLIDYLLSGNNDTFNYANCDATRDGYINIADVTGLINYLLSGYWPWEIPQPVAETETFTVNGESFMMVTVEGGMFGMGTNDSSVYCYEKPAHRVILSTYCIGQTEVTQPLWRAVMGCDPAYYTTPMLGDPNRPMERVSWDQCQKFILKLNELTGKHFRLPTEAEWEFAARGGNLSHEYMYSGSDALDDVAWYGANDEFAMTKIVGTKVPNELGLYDMSGNVREWCQDRTEVQIYLSQEALDYYRYGRYVDAGMYDPVGPVWGDYHVVRGGDFRSEATDCRVTAVESEHSAYKSAVIGLRLALDVEDSPKFRLSETVITLVKGESKTVDILNGDGAYQLDFPDKKASGTISGNSLVVTGDEVGTTSVYVTNNATGVVAVVNVIVTPVLNFTVNGTSFEMVDVEGSSFMRGAVVHNEFREYSWEAPSFSWLYMSDYCIGKTEVTQELWRAVMGNNPSYFKGDLNRPVDQVSWNDCQEFIARLNELTGKRFRLPTEAEWEYAARGGIMSQGYQYSGSGTIGDVAWYANNSNNMTHPVGAKASNELGLFDMTGNVWEWCLDWVEEEEHPYYEGYKICGPVYGTTRVRRGGCWSGSADNCRLLTTTGSAPSDSNIRLGFRLVLEDDDKPEFRLGETVITLPVGGSCRVYLYNGTGIYKVEGGEDNVACEISGDGITVTGLHEGINTVHVSTGTGSYFYDTMVLTVIVKPRETN